MIALPYGALNTRGFLARAAISASRSAIMKALASNEISSENHGVKFLYLCRFLHVMLCITAFTLIRADFRQVLSQDSTRSKSDEPVYFPPGVPEMSTISAFLGYMGEPSLLEAAKDTSVHSFRVTWVGGQNGHAVAVRLVVDVDGGGQVTSAVTSFEFTGIKRTKYSVSAADVEKLLQLVENAGFWSMRRTERRTDGDTGRKVYEFDGTFWMVEGVRNGSFHHVYRRSPEPSPFTEVGRYLAKDLAKLDDSVIFIPKYISPGQ
jgi:hypothetical protein